MAECTAMPEKHRATILHGVGCTKAAAEDQIILSLLQMAADERKQKCEKCTCAGFEDGDCIVTLNPDSLDALLKQVVYRRFITEKCPNKVGWSARLAAKKNSFISECDCVNSSLLEEGGK